MTTAITGKRPCSKCGKGSSIFTCHGCQQSFCRKHADEHRQELTDQVETLGQEHDILQRDINNETTHHPLLSRIDTWERESINKIQQVANQARHDLNKFIGQTKQSLKMTMDRLKSELQMSREAEDYTELDLKKWIDQLTQIRLDLEKSMSLYHLNGDVNDDQKSIIHFISVEDTQSATTSHRNSSINRNSIAAKLEKFSRQDEAVKLSDEDLVATYSGSKLRRSAILFGANLYSKGKHLIRFRIERKTNGNFYFGIVTHTQHDPESIFSTLTTAYGWWRCDYAVVLGVVRRKFSIIEILEGDEVTLSIDCDQRKIFLDHHRTQRSVQLLVDIDKCALPWKLVVALSSVGNCIRMLH
ncbi:unnamed protein product [Rotaria socialis]|uniref:B box-type domain-containing protein n=1 Tax=Rotaria socialis TaxID=392032 RepID=A0A817TG98_9BILA|nr:unnamed protein product [Rotaria socialis]CAF4703309.1 unnamed protein product [Rotaria socialis]